MTDPSSPHPRGRHSQPDADTGAGRPASELLAAWTDADPMSDTAVRRGRRRAPDTDAAMTPARPAGGIGLAERPGLPTPRRDDERAAPPRVLRGPAAAAATPAGWPWGGDDRGAAGAAQLVTAPRTTEMSAARPVLPALDGRPTTRQSAPVPRLPDDASRPRPAAGSGARRPADPEWAAGSLGGLTGAGPWRAESADDLATEVHPAVDGGHLPTDPRVALPGTPSRRAAEQRHHAPEPDGERFYDEDRPRTGEHRVFDETGGLEMIVDEGAPDEPPTDHGGGGGGRGRRGRSGGGGGGRRRKRRPLTVLLSLLVLAGVVLGALFGGKVLWQTINPMAEDYSGAGTGQVEIRVNDGDSLRTVAGTLVEADVIASAEPFLDAAEANASATGLQPGVYNMRLQMSGQAALDLLLHPDTKMVTRVTIPEGQTVAQTLQRLADGSDVPLEEWQAAAADPAALGLPPYANGLLEGFLFPATYEVDPDDTPVSVLTEMVSGTVAMLDELQVPVERRLSVITEASIVQAEASSVEDMAKVAQVLNNRIAQGMRLQMDSTVNYANGKGGITTTAEDRANPSPYNTYAHEGLPPGAISNPGRDAVAATMNPAPGDWLFFVVVDPDTGDTRFAATAEEHGRNVLLFQQWLQENPGN
ncbi:endolytic transglycosylase MltG [Modestobacter marinus]|uniref:endolytic transglycosylase MltG n=1 Tax=Modestobacter marinus TaxID=477641 RepID=UPI001C982656|nr:endolytic transglycosylase MltG [Modestobacter marinus]